MGKKTQKAECNVYFIGGEIFSFKYAIFRAITGFRSLPLRKSAIPNLYFWSVTKDTGIGEFFASQQNRSKRCVRKTFMCVYAVFICVEIRKGLNRGYVAVKIRSGNKNFKSKILKNKVKI